ncbi:MAG: amidohydrolase family protein [Pirellulales bacterium]|nr:amidohydrolase family protein [Pirellulales bacterium]
MKPTDLKRRDFVRYSALGLTGATLSQISVPASSATPELKKPGKEDPLHQKVLDTCLIDTHEHLMNESERIQAEKTIWDNANDWTFLLSHYFDSDLVVAGMSQEDHDRFYSTALDPLEKWKLIEPYWPHVKHTGYGLNVRHTLKDVYGIDDLTGESVRKLEEAYHATIKPGFYKHLLRDIGNIESCQVNLWPFLESEQPDLLMCDLHISGMIEENWDPRFAEEAKIDVKTLADWHRVIDYWITTYGKKAVAVKSTMAYHRDLDCIRTPPEEVDKIFLKKLNKEPMTPTEQKSLEDHLFWYTVDRATEMGLPVKLHTGYYCGHGRMPLGRIRGNPAAICGLCQQAPETRFVLFHICYPYYEEMLSIAKHYPNAYMDMCWSWIINPLAAKDFLKKYLVTAPANKIFPFGGDYIPVELVPGHAAIARQGITQALSELVNEQWMALEEAINLTDIIMHENARKLYGI